MLLDDFPRDAASEGARLTLDITEQLLELGGLRGWTVCTVSDFLGRSGDRAGLGSSARTKSLSRLAPSAATPRWCCG